MKSRAHGRSSLAAALALGLVAAACGDSGTDTSTEASNDETTTTVAPTADGTTDTTAAPAASSTSGGAATDDEFLALCPPETAPDSLTIAIWGSHQESVGAQMAEFTDLTGVEIVWHTDGTEDRLVKLNAEKGNPTIDLAVLPINEVGALLDNGVIVPADPAVPNSDVLVEAARREAGWGTSQIQFGIVYNPEYVQDPPDTWMGILDDAYAGHISIGDIPGSGGYAYLAMLARELGGSEEDLTPAIDAVAAAKDGILEFSTQAQASIQQFDTEELWIYAGIAGTMEQYKEDGGPVEVHIPSAGGPVGMNVGVIPAGNPDEDCAKALLGWYLGPEVQTAYAETLYYTPVNTAVELDPELAEKVYPKDEGSVVILDWDAIAEDTIETIDYWNRTVKG